MTLENKNPVFLHYHIFKNGGQTLEWILEKNFSKYAIRIDTEDPGGILSNDVLLDCLNKNQKIKSISSHQIRFPVPESTSFHFIPIMFIRHPIDRAVSVYYFNRKRTDLNTKAVQKTKSLDLNEFLKWNLENKTYKVLKNFQVLHLSKTNVNSDVVDIDLQLAKNRLKQCEILGVVDRFDESLVVAEELLKQNFSDIDLSYIKLNVSPNRRDKLSKRLDDLKSLVEEEVFSSTEKVNELDLDLYATTNMELDNRLKKIKNLDEKLEDFRNRCRMAYDSTQKSSRFLRNDRILYSTNKQLYYHEKEGIKVPLKDLIKRGIKF